MFVVRYWSYGSITDLTVNAESSIKIFNMVQKAYKNVDLLFIHEGIEYCLL